MKIKILGILVCIMFFGASILPSIAGYEKVIDKKEINDYNNLIKQAIESGIISRDDWLEQDKLLASDNRTREEFGWSVSIDRDYAIIGIRDSPIHEGAAYIFTRSGTVWTEQAKLLSSDLESDDAFGYSVSIDGDTAIIGAPKYAHRNLDDSGSAYIFTRNGTVWTEQAKLLASDSEVGSLFGISVSLDGETTIIGACSKDDNGDESGSAYIFTGSGSTWTQQAKLLASDGAEGDLFGYSVSLDGNYTIIGAVCDGDEGENYGSAYIFTRSGTVWTEQAKLLASDGAELDLFGISVSIDNDTVVIGAKFDDDNGNESGSAYVFTRSGTVWIEQAKLLASDGAMHDFFGYSVSIDGDIVIIGAPAYFDYKTNSGPGSVYIFTRSGTTWTEQAKLLASDGLGGDAFGWSVSIDGDYVIIGAFNDDVIEWAEGSAYVFTRKLTDFVIDGLSPIDLNITDADGRFINKNFSNIPGATYTEVDLDGDGELDDRIIIPDALDGLYTIEVIPEPDADPTDIFSLRTSYIDESYYLVEDELIQNIPPEGYSLSWPDKPSTPQGETNGKAGESYTYTSSTSDPDGDQIYYLFDWGDGTDSGWIGTGEASHTWIEKGTYGIKVIAKDIHDFISDWSDSLLVSITKSKTVNRPFLNWLQIHPNMFPLLQRLLQRLELQ
jgi:hypothetical protein